MSSGRLSLITLMAALSTRPAAVIGEERGLRTGLMADMVVFDPVATWQVIYYRISPDWMEKYVAHGLEKARTDGETEAQIAKRKADLDKFAEMYKNPAINAAITFLEPLPVALVMALVSAGVLSRRRKEEGVEIAATGARVLT